MIVLGIETSCDETAAAIVNNKREILSNIILSQLEEHAVFGGVVPEIAARAHLLHIEDVIKAAMYDANIQFSQLDAIAATCGPGLIGGVMVGMMAGKAIAASQKKPFLAINHLEGHALTPRLTENISFPYLLLLISGGHTQILVVEGVGKYQRWGTTLDDAAGECFDKSAKLLGLGFPGGPHLEKTANACLNTKEALSRFPLPVPLKGRDNCDFSFSGLKTSVRNHVEKLGRYSLTQKDKADLAYAFQITMSEILADRCSKAIQRFKSVYGNKTEIPTLVIAGGVSANLTIREGLENLTKQHNVQLSTAPLGLCTDNAAMIAWAGLERLNLGRNSDSLAFKALPRWPLDPNAQASHRQKNNG